MRKICWKETLKLWAFCALNIPLIFWLRPQVLELNQQRSIIKIKLNRRSKNHLGSMYFGALCTGAELAPGLIAINLIAKQKYKINFLFKEFRASFLKRCEGNVEFICDDGDKIAKAIDQAVQTKERQNIPVSVKAVVPDLGDETYAEFALTLSLRLVDRG